MVREEFVIRRSLVEMVEGSVAIRKEIRVLKEKEGQENKRS